MKLKEIREYSKLDYVIDITNWTIDDVCLLVRNHRIEIIGKSKGIYGINGVLVRDEGGHMYAVTARNSNLFILC